MLLVRIIRVRIILAGRIVLAGRVVFTWWVVGLLPWAIVSSPAGAPVRVLAHASAAAGGETGQAEAQEEDEEDGEREEDPAAPPVPVRRPAVVGVAELVIAAEGRISFVWGGLGDETHMYCCRLLSRMAMVKIWKKMRKGLE